MKRKFPFQVSWPTNMTILEQVVCMVWLATTCTLKELRERQSLLERQFRKAIQNNRPESVFKELEAIQSNTDAAVAYQSFDDDNTWLAFINVFPEV